MTNSDEYGPERTCECVCGATFRSPVRHTLLASEPKPDLNHTSGGWVMLVRQSQRPCPDCGRNVIKGLMRRNEQGDNNESERRQL